MNQPGLFAEPALDGLRFWPDLIGSEQEAKLIAQLDAADLAPFRFQRWTGKRCTRTFGWRYDFEDNSFAPAEPFPDWLETLAVDAAGIAEVVQGDFVHALLARYDPGAGIGWHRDRPVFEKVVGISLGSEAVLRFRQRVPSGFRRFSLTLPPRSAYLLTGEARWEWEHSIAPAAQRRYSITLRTLSELGRRRGAAAS